jgi:hypothetical protein
VLSRNKHRRPEAEERSEARTVERVGAFTLCCTTIKSAVQLAAIVTVAFTLFALCK